MINNSDEKIILLKGDLQILSKVFRYWNVRNANSDYWCEAVERMKRAYPADVLAAALDEKVIEQRRAQAICDQHDRYGVKLMLKISGCLSILCLILTILLAPSTDLSFRLWPDQIVMMFKLLMMINLLLIFLAWLKLNSFRKKLESLRPQVHLLEDVLSIRDADDALGSEFIYEAEDLVG